jgi:hypothetical protein
VSRSQREKGKRGERDAAKALTAALRLTKPARRGVQYQGGKDSADIRVDIEGIHWEVKFVERESVRAWMQQAQEDAGSAVPVVLHRKSRAPWLVTLPAERLYEFIQRLEEAAAQAVSEVGAAEVSGAVPTEVLPEEPAKHA